MKHLMTIFLTLIFANVQASGPTAPAIGVDSPEVVSAAVNPAILAGGVSDWERDNQMIKGGTAFCGNGVCELDEDCDLCPADCVSGTTSGATCGNGVCEAGDGEDCLTCAADCNGEQRGRPGNRFCCGDNGGENPVSCDDSRCNSAGLTCTGESQPPEIFCCGDMLCSTGESCSNCAVECSLGPELCSGGLDEDCDGAIDCDDADCAVERGCICGVKGASCEIDDQCCSNKCKGKPGAKTCK